eukprot:CAMPEP_0202894770 /NCGR_PEP_ID=MMETSP1392-20130828/4096_1 /ASSEMBLY_ACC=CAM_ASM_000868 /TAXON_ID=225041 /ORGANISM="Chlamydomonas chlamydogama, Strain SAG 11-48b" /LENGTH=47 /DNA_ID= /DNA_START= /DNA_END= /DNA_ORIENTATION=
MFSVQHPAGVYSWPSVVYRGTVLLLAWRGVVLPLASMHDSSGMNWRA